MDNPIAPGDVILGKYRVERELGKGGMGVVVAARHVDLGQLYAIKFLLPAMLGHTESLERFLREARAASRLESDHVARVHDVGRMENGTPYMVMEYLDGCDLKVFLVRQGPLSVEEAVSYLLQVSDAIAEAHELGIVHRDLKPANLFLMKRRNGSPCVKVLDFGISKYTGPEEVDLTGTNASFGSPLYMSPEQMARSKSVDSRTDIWAMGVILYELLVGKSPFKASSMTEVVSRVLQEDPAPVRETRPDVSPGLEAVILRCLQKRREERFATVGELVAALSPFVSGQAMRASMATGVSVDRVETPAPVEPQAATVQMVATKPEAQTVELTAGAWGGTGPSVLKPRPRRSIMIAALLVAVVGVGGAGVWLGLRGRQASAVVEADSGIATTAAVASSAVVEVPQVKPVELSPVPDNSPMPEKASATAADSSSEPKKMPEPLVSTATPLLTSATAKAVKPVETAKAAGNKKLRFDD